MTTGGARPRAGFLAFLALASATLLVLFADAWTKGWVLSQAGLLYRFEPWASNLPPGGPPAANPLLGDIPAVFYPFLVHAVDRLRHGEFPLWSTAIFAGHPFFASFQSALLSPFTLIALVVPLPHATVAIAVARLAVGGLGMAAFARALGLGRHAVVFAGLAWLVNPFSIVWLEHPLSAVAAWLPWVLWGVERAARRPGPKRAAGLAVVTLLTILAGHPETTLKLFLFGAAWGLVRAAASPARTRALLTLAAGSTLGVLASAVQVVPFVEYLLQSRAYLDRAGAPANPFFAPLLTAVTAVVPDFFGHPVEGTYLPMQNRLGAPANYCEQQVYAGIATWLLAAVGLAARRRDARAWALGGSAAVAALLMYNVPGVASLLRVIPGLNVTALSRFGLVVVAAAVVLAAFGVDELTRTRRENDRVGRTPAGTPRNRTRDLAADRVNSPSPPRWLWRAPVAATALAAAGVLACLAWCRPMLVANGQFGRTLVACGVAALLAAFVLAVVRARLGGRLGTGAFAAGVTLLLLIDLLAFGRGFHPMAPASAVYPDLPEIEAVRRDPGVFRVLGLGRHFLPNAALVYELQDPRGYDGMWPARYTALLDTALAGFPPFHQANGTSDTWLLDLLNVKYVVAPAAMALPADRFTRLDGGRSVVTRNERALPRAWLVSRYLVADQASALRTVRDGRADPREVVVLERELPEDERPERGSSPSADAGTATIAHYRHQVVDVVADAPRRAVLVLADACYPGWQATVDGAPATIHRANAAFRAVAVPAGRHVIRFEYRPRSVRIGLGISLAALALVVGLALWRDPRDSGAEGDASQDHRHDLGGNGTSADEGRRSESRREHPEGEDPGGEGLGNVDLRGGIPGAEDLGGERPGGEDPGTSSIDLSIVCLMENGDAPAAAGVSGLAAAVRDVVERAGVRHEAILVVPPGTGDESPAGEAPPAAAEPGIRVVRADSASVGGRLRRGLQASTGSHVLVVCEPSALDAGLVGRMWDRRHAAGAVIVSSETTARNAKRGIGTSVAARLARVLVHHGLSLPSGEPWFPAGLFRREAIAGVRVEAQGPSALVELLVRINADGWEIEKIDSGGVLAGASPRPGDVSSWTRDLRREFLRLWRLRNSPFSADYDDRAFDSLIPLQRYWQRTRHARITGFLGRADRVLDVGCGSSRIILGLPHAVGVDIQLKKLRRVQRTARRLVQATLTRLPFASASFDAVICSQVVEHVTPDLVDWSEFVRVLVPGGHFIVGTPDYGTLTWRALEWAYMRVHPDGYSTEHVNQYTAARLRRELEAAGFEVTGQAYVGGGELIVRARKR